MDVFSPDERSRVMRRVKGKNTSIEKRVRSLLFSLGFRYRLHVPSLPGKPDIVFPKRRKIILVHGCFWHGHNCPRGARKPKSNQEYWEEKIRRNHERDKRTLADLEKSEWRVLVVWECEMRDMEAVREKLLSFLE